MASPIRQTDHNSPPRVNFRMTLLALLLSGSMTVATAFAQDAPTPVPIHKLQASSTDSVEAATRERRDVFDVLAKILHKPRVEPELTTVGATGVEWSLLPSISYNSVYGVAIGGSLTAAGWPGQGENARPIVLSISGTYSTEGQLLAQVRGDVYSRSGGYLLKPDVRYLDTTRSTWGLGPIVPDQSEYPMDFQLLRVYGTLLRRVGGPLYVGMGLHLDQNDHIVDTRAEAGESTPFTEYSGGTPSRTRSVAFSINILGDTRDNLVNPKKGYLLSAYYRGHSKSLGSDEEWQEFLTELRIYTRLPRNNRHILGFWLYNWISFGPAPYLDLPASGWDTYGRGARAYKQGRIRGDNQIYLEGEYRMELRRDGLLGAVVFLNSTHTTTPDSRLFSPGDLGAGIGMRIKFNKKSETNLVIDYGWGREGARGLTLAMSEAF